MHSEWKELSSTYTNVLIQVLSMVELVKTKLMEFFILKIVKSSQLRTFFITRLVAFMKCCLLVIWNSVGESLSEQIKKAPEEIVKLLISIFSEVLLSI